MILYSVKAGGLPLGDFSIIAMISEVSMQAFIPLVVRSVSGVGSEYMLTSPSGLEL